MSAKYCIVSDKPELFHKLKLPSRIEVISSWNYISESSAHSSRKLRVINLCDNTNYLSRGYYVSLMAEARGQKCMPDVDSILHLDWKRNHVDMLEKLQDKLAKLSSEGCLSKRYMIIFGRSTNPELEQLGRAIFDVFRFPILSVEITFRETTKLESIKPIPLSQLPAGQMEFFHECLLKYLGEFWAEKKQGMRRRHWLAILYSDLGSEKVSSNKRAIEKCIQAARRQNIAAEVITRQELDALVEYDALFIRDTTAIDNHTYRFALKAWKEQIPCIDDHKSIIRCCNKIYLSELLTINKLDTPRSSVVDRKTLRAQAHTLDYPVVVKLPDSSFSLGVFLSHSAEELLSQTEKFFARTDFLLLQEFLPTPFDWRIGVLDGEPLFACKYFMAQNHWQIQNNQAKLSEKYGKFMALDLSEVPVYILKLAVQSSRLIGDGFYGVDIKETERRGAVVTEVNDNPNLDAGVEDLLYGNRIYDRLISSFIRRIEGPSPEAAGAVRVIPDPATLFPS